MPKPDGLFPLQNIKPFNNDISSVFGITPERQQAAREEDRLSQAHRKEVNSFIERLNLIGINESPGLAAEVAMAAFLRYMTYYLSGGGYFNIQHSELFKEKITLEMLEFIKIHANNVKI